MPILHECQWEESVGVNPPRGSLGFSAVGSIYVTPAEAEGNGNHGGACTWSLSVPRFSHAQCFHSPRSDRSTTTTTTTENLRMATITTMTATTTSTTKTTTTTIDSTSKSCLNNNTTASNFSNNNNNKSSNNNNKSPTKPRRNLTQAFEALCVASSSGPEKTVKAGKQTLSDHPPPYHEPTSSSSCSPTAVVDEVLLREESTGVTPTTIPLTKKVPHIALLPDLQRDLSQECVARISMYSIIHDINKEASTLVTLDPLKNTVLDGEQGGPLLQAFANQILDPLVLLRSNTTTTIRSNRNHTTTTGGSTTTAQTILIDEERWIIQEIQLHHEDNYVQDCPPTFCQAIGEKEYDHPHRVGRTQLWKPSRSWWEAKSGKNPWIQPSLHNKRWRYLWPLIHYHKFLAKCIKKLKRNGLDVTLSVHPISIFLRQEVCAVSDHLAAVSLFGSETWMRCLNVFEGWIITNDPEATRQYRRYVAALPLRSDQEPADVDSPVLREQIDEAFLRTLAQQQHDMNHHNIDTTDPYDGAKPEYSTIAATTESTTPRPQPTQDPENVVPRHIHQRYHYRWYDANSVHSELSANSSCYTDYNTMMYMHNYYPDATAANSHHSHTNHNTTSYFPNHPATAYPWMNYYPMYAYNTTTNTTPMGECSSSCHHPYPVTPVSASHDTAHMASPYWAHLEQLAHMGFNTPSTPRRPPRKTPHKEK